MKIEADGNESISSYVSRLATEAEITNEVVEGEFNGTPMMVWPGDSEDEVHDRWWQDGRARERAKAVEDAAVLRDAMVGKGISSVASFFQHGENQICITLDDGSQFVTRDLRKMAGS